MSFNGTDQTINGLSNPAHVHWNDPVPALYQQAIARNEGLLSRGGALVVNTGQHTGRSPKDKFTVRDATTEAAVDWGDVNIPFEPELYDRLFAKVSAYLQRRTLFVQDLHAGADPDYRLAVRVVSESAWHALFARNMFRIPPHADLAGFEPGFTVLHAPYLLADPARDGTRSETFVVVNFTERTVLIGGTWYAGEIKKSIFGVLNHVLPEFGVLPMHCSANMGARGDVAVFFGLSGTGKTTLSADGSRRLIGDDEHGWSETGVFNFEGGCYAKVIRLSQQAEPEIYATTERFGTVLENVVVDPATRELDLDDDRLTENTRASYPLEFIPNVEASGLGGHPENIVMLAADAFGVLPPISKLTPEQAMYHFLSGYTARVAGTEKGVKEPQATFSTCFGAPFMPRHPTVYAEMLRDKMARHGTACWLVNTGWSGGGYGVGQRMPIAHTRSMVRAAVEGRLNNAPLHADPHFGLLIPEACPDVPAEVLQPKSTWPDGAAYDAAAREVAGRFAANFARFEPHVGEAVKAAGVRAAA